jgi:hypothetical protein
LQQVTPKISLSSMTRRRKNAIELAAAIQRAEATADLAAKMVEQFARASDTVLAASDKVAHASSETIAGLVGGGVGLGSGAFLVATTAIVGVASPLVILAAGVVGVGAGILALRGRHSISYDRALRDERRRLESMKQQATLLRSEIDEVKKMNGPPETVTKLWSSYDNVVAAIGMSSAEAGKRVATPSIRGLLGPGSAPTG